MTDATRAPNKLSRQQRRDRIELIAFVCWLAVVPMALISFAWMETSSNTGFFGDLETDFETGTIKAQVIEQADEVGAHVFDLPAKDYQYRQTNDVEIVTSTGEVLEGRVIVENNDALVVVANPSIPGKWVSLTSEGGTEQ